jgi:transcriptional repressor NrdR
LQLIGARRQVRGTVELHFAQREVASNKLGELVMRELKKLDKVAYVRFASVYRSFEDIDDFKLLVDEVSK